MNSQLVPLRRPFAQEKDAYALLEKLYKQNPQLCDALLDWSLVNFGKLAMVSFINLVLLIDHSGSEKGHEREMAAAYNEIIKNLGKTPMTQFTFCTVIFFSDNASVAVPFMPLLNVPMMAAPGAGAQGDIIFQPDDSTNLSEALIGAMMQKMMLGDLALNSGFTTRTIVVALTDGAHNHGVFSHPEVELAIRAAHSQAGRLFLGIVSIGDPKVADYARSVGLNPGDVWAIENTAEALQSMGRTVSSQVTYHSTRAVTTSKKGQPGFWGEEGAEEEEAPLWEQDNQGP